MKKTGPGRRIKKTAFGLLGLFYLLAPQEAFASGGGVLGLSERFEQVFTEILSVAFWIAGIALVLFVITWWFQKQGGEMPMWLGRIIIGAVVISSAVAILTFLGLQGASF